jgi:hypothetical protein
MRITKGGKDNKLENGNLNVFEIVTVLHYMDLSFESFIQYYDWG